MTEDWYFCSHRLPVARAARDAGFDIVVATRVRDHGAAISAEGFALRPLAWRRRGDGLRGAARAIAAIVRLYRREQPDILHHVALKSVLFGGVAARIAFAGRRAPAQIAAIMGLGSGFSTTSLAGALRRPLLRTALRLAVRPAQVIVQNPEDRAAIAAIGVPLPRISLIRGSGVDTVGFAALPEFGGATEGSTITIALVSRMLRAKGVPEAVAAVRRLRDAGLPVELLLAGPVDRDNPNSLSTADLTALSELPGIVWLGPVSDVRTVWRRAGLAILPSTYGEGVPMALLEAAACARPMIATDVAGCREIVRPGLTGLLVPPGDIERLADAIAVLAGDPAQRRAMGLAARRLVEREFAEAIVVGQTLALYRAALGETGARGSRVG